MTPGAVVFMAISWAFVLGLVSWAYYRILTHKKHFDPDGIGPASPPEPARYEAQPDGKAGRRERPTTR